MSEQSKTKCIGITIETRPDYCLKQHLRSGHAPSALYSHKGRLLTRPSPTARHLFSQMLRYGCTRLEIGVQSVYEDVARDTNRSALATRLPRDAKRRGPAWLTALPLPWPSAIAPYSGHTVKAVCESFELSKDAGYKVVAHMMPDLPNVGLERDLEQFIVREGRVRRPFLGRHVRSYSAALAASDLQELFANPAFRPDGLKLYPTLVIRGTGPWTTREPPHAGAVRALTAGACGDAGLYELWRSGRYKNYPPEVLVDLVAKILALVPPWTRVYRVQRYRLRGPVARPLPG